MSPPIGEIVAIDRCYDHVLETQLSDGSCDVLRLAGIERTRQARPHIAKGAGPCAGVAHDHDGRVALFPTLANIRAPGFLANRMQTVGANDARCLRVRWRARRLHADPRGLEWAHPAHPGSFQTLRIHFGGEAFHSRSKQQASRIFIH